MTKIKPTDALDVVNTPETVTPDTIHNNPHNNSHDSSQEHLVRVEKVKKLRELGIEPWPEYKNVNAIAQDVLEQFIDTPTPSDDQANPKQPENIQEYTSPEYTIAGRVIALRWHGKSAFAKVQDRSGQLQIYLKSEDLGQEQFSLLQNYIDLGDIIWVRGNSFKTKTGEITLKAHEIVLLSKCLHPLPEKFHGIADIEIKYRQRYLDLISDQDSKHKFITRSKLISGLRQFLESHGFIEVETPMLHPIPGGAAAKPFITHHNALHSDFYLRIAPELYLKRLVIGGFERVYEINRNFRNEGVSTRHNPEFTMLEFYLAHQNYTYIMQFVEDMFRSVIQKSCGSEIIPFGQHTIDFSKKFDRLNAQQAIIKYSNLTDHDISPEHINNTLAKLNVKLENKNASYAQKIFAIFEEVAEQKLIQPTFLIEYPLEVSPLAKRDPNNPETVARFELFIGGMELSNGFNELNDPFDQAERFKGQVENRDAGDDEAHHYDADFIRALEYGLPPTVGCGIGIDRLAMLLTNTTSIKDVILFPTLKKQH